MAKWRLTLEDGRQTEAYADNEDGAKKQSNHQEMTRVMIAQKRGLPHGKDPSFAISAEKIKP